MGKLTQGFGFMFTLLLALAIAACAPNAKNEQQYWDNHAKDAKEYSSKWPGFTTVLNARQAKAKPLWDSAIALSDDKAKAAKMKEANEVIGSMTSKLGEVKYKSESIEKTIEKLNGLKLPKDKDKKRNEAVSSAHAELDAVDAAMRAAKPATDEEALKVVDAQVSKLISAGGDADRAYTALKK